jgi:hypothetical protein
LKRRLPTRRRYCQRLSSFDAIALSREPKNFGGVIKHLVTTRSVVYEGVGRSWAGFGHRRRSDSSVLPRIDERSTTMAETKRMTAEQLVSYPLEKEGVDFLFESPRWVVQ